MEGRRGGRKEGRREVGRDGGVEGRKEEGIEGWIDRQAADSSAKRERISDGKKRARALLGKPWNQRGTDCTTSFAVNLQPLWESRLCFLVCQLNHILHLRQRGNSI